jgi:hypothetical protein
LRSPLPGIRAALIAATSIFCIPGSASNARLASPPPVANASVSTRDFVAVTLPLFHGPIAKKIPWTCVLDHTIAVAAVQLLLPLTDYRSGDAEPLIGRQTSASHLWCR